MNKLNEAMVIIEEANKDYEHVKYIQKQIYDLLFEDYDKNKHKELTDENMKLKSLLIDILSLEGEITHNKILELTKKHGIVVNSIDC